MYAKWVERWQELKASQSQPIHKGSSAPRQESRAPDASPDRRQAGGSAAQRHRAIPSVNLEALAIANHALTPEEAFILSRIDGQTSIEELHLMLPRHSIEDLTGFLRKLWKSGTVTFGADAR